MTVKTKASGGRWSSAEVLEDDLLTICFDAVALADPLEDFDSFPIFLFYVSEIDVQLVLSTTA